jgi:hypothetical protein
MERTVVVPLWSLAIGTVLSLLLVVMNFALLMKTHDLTRTAQVLDARQRPPVGLPFPSLHGLTPTGGRLDLDTSNLTTKVLVFVLSSNCEACEINWPTWERLASSDKQIRTLFVDLPGTATAEYLKRHHLTGETVLSGLDPRMQIGLNIRATPTTVILDKHGKIVHSWTGVLAKSDETEALRSLGSK